VLVETKVRRDRDTEKTDVLAGSDSRLSPVCLSVTLVDCNNHIGWNSSEVISPLVSLVGSLSAHPNIRGLLEGEHPEIFAQSDPPLLIWAKETFDRKLRPNGYTAQRSQWRVYRKPPSLFRMVPSLTPYDLPFSPNGGSICSQDTLHVWFYGRVFRVGGSNGAISGYIKSKMAAWIISNGHISATAHSIHLYSAHRAVIFATAQLFLDMEVIRFSVLLAILCELQLLHSC